MYRICTYNTLLTASSILFIFYSRDFLFTSLFIAVTVAYVLNYLILQVFSSLPGAGIFGGDIGFHHFLSFFFFFLTLSFFVALSSPPSYIERYLNRTVRSVLLLRLEYIFSFFLLLSSGEEVFSP